MCTAAEGKDAGRRIYVMGRNLMEHRKYITAIWHILAASVPAFLLVLAVLWDPLYTFDSLLCDHLYTRLGRVGKDIKIIAVDEETLDAYGNYNLWSREKMAELVETLYADETAMPALLAFDFLFTGDAEKQTDDRLADACKKHDNLIAASSLVYRGVTKQTEEGEIYYDVWNIDLVEEPYAALSGAVRSGFTNAYIAEDGCVRYTKLMERFEGQELPSFAWLIYDTYEKQNGRQSVMPGTTGNGQVTFFYSGQVGEFPHFSLRDVLDGTIPTSEFKDCIVLIGAYAPGFQDAYVAAADRGNPMYGVEIQANIVRALQQGKTAVPLPVWIYLIPSGILLYLFFKVAKKQKLFPVIAEAAVLMALHLLAGRLLAGCGYTISQIYFLGILAAGVLYFIIGKYVAERIRRKRMLSTFKKYVASQVVDELAKDDNFKTRLGGEKRSVAVLFVDIRGFTPMSESLKPEQVVKILNEYLALTTASILQNNGMLDKFIGDATMAVFNAPLDLDDYVFRAVQAALDMRRGAEKLAEKLQEQFGKTVSFGIGVNCGEAVIGNIGCEFRMDYTAIGDTVNTAARLESRAKPREILISQVVYDAVKDRIVAEEVGPMELKGKSNTVMVYRVLDVKEGASGE